MEVPEIQIHPDLLKEIEVGNKKFRSAMDFHLYDSDIEICRKELKQPEDVNASIQKLREMLCGDGDIRYRTDDAYLLRFLRYKKFDVKETYKHLRRFCRYRTENPNLFYVPTRLDKLLNSDMVYLLPYTKEDGTLVFILKLGQWNIDEFDFSDNTVLFNIISDVLCSNPHSQITGITDILDFSNVTLSHIAQYSHPRNIKIWSMIMQEFYPWRVKSIVCYNCNAFLYGAFLSIRMFVKKKIADRLVPLRGDLEELHQHAPPTVLPKEYGGNLEESEYKAYLGRCILDNLRYIQYEHSFIEGNKK